MKHMIKFPSIPQMKPAIKTLIDRLQYQGTDENSEPVFNRNLVLPKVKFHGTVKLHGTNASISFNQISGMWSQSRERIITPESDNAGFAMWAYSNRLELLPFFKHISDEYNIDLTKNTLCIYGEWCGKGIQSGTAINQLDKMFVVFGVKVAPFSETEDEVVNYWIDSSNISNESIRVFNIEQFPTYDVEVDLNAPSLSQNEVVELTLSVERECPVGKYFGVTGIGEGLVFTHKTDDGNVIRFKSKGELHSNSKVKTVKVIDNELEQLKYSLAEELTPNWRIDQGVAEVFDTLNGGTPDIKRLGEVIKWVNTDIMKEELHRFVELGIEPKLVLNKTSQFVRRRFFELYN